MNSNWIEYKLIDVVNLKSGTTVKKGLERESGDVAYLKVSGMNLEGNEVKITTANTYLNHEDINIKNILPIGSTIFPKRGGAIATNKKRLTDIPLCVDLNTMGIIPKSELVIPLYIYFYFKTFDLLSISNGTTIPQINNYSFDKLKISVPPIPEQKRIVALLDTVFADLEQIRAKTEQNLKNARELFNNYLQQVFTVKGEGWVETTIGELCEKMEYGTSSKSQLDGDIPVLRMGNIQGGELDWEKLKYTSNESDIDKLLLKENDVLFNRTNSPELVGKSAIYRNERPAIFAGYLIRIHRKKELLDANYLNYYLNSNLARTYGFSIMSHSTNQANINGTKLKSYPINIPNIAKQLSLGNSFRELESEINKIENIYKKKLLRIDELKKSILQKAFSGKLTTTAK